jgi:hypothetical protein
MNKARIAAMAVRGEQIKTNDAEYLLIYRRGGNARR